MALVVALVAAFVGGMVFRAGWAIASAVVQRPRVMEAKHGDTVIVVGDSARIHLKVNDSYIEVDGPRNVIHSNNGF